MRSAGGVIVAGHDHLAHVVLEHCIEGERKAPVDQGDRGEDRPVLGHLHRLSDLWIVGDEGHGGRNQRVEAGAHVVKEVGGGSTSATDEAKLLALWRRPVGGVHGCHLEQTCREVHLRAAHAAMGERAAGLSIRRWPRSKKAARVERGRRWKGILCFHDCGGDPGGHNGIIGQDVTERSGERHRSTPGCVTGTNRLQSFGS